MYNKVILMGRIASDLELKLSPQGTEVCSFRLAVERDYQTSGKERETDFFSITAWRQTAEFICKYFKKGQLIHIDGALRTRQYTDKNGNSATWYEIVAQSVSFTGDRGKTQDTEETSAAAENNSGINESAAESFFLNENSEDNTDAYPF